MKLTDSVRGEIVMMYRQAADRKKQLSILAELFLMSKLEIARILFEAGFTEGHIKNALSKKRTKDSQFNKWTPSEEEELRRLLGENYSYAECARLLGRTKNSICSKIDRLGI